MRDLPSHLAQNQPQGLIEGEPVAQFEIGSHQNFVYLILDWSTKKAAIMDPQKDLSPPLGGLKKHGFELTSVFLTHSHSDHTAGLSDLLGQYPELPVIVHPKDKHRLKRFLRGMHAIHPAADGELLQVGSLPVRILHTPGHSAGACSYLLSAARDYLFTGDTIFIRDCGRTDLDTGSTEEMFSSLQRVRTLAPETIFLPGHHYAPECATTLERELRESPPFLCRTIEELARLP